jgi:hypothetical protein
MEECCAWIWHCNIEKGGDLTALGGVVDAKGRRFGSERIEVLAEEGSESRDSAL